MDTILNPLIPLLQIYVAPILNPLIPLLQIYVAPIVDLYLKNYYCCNPKTRKTGIDCYESIISIYYDDDDNNDDDDFINKNRSAESEPLSSLNLKHRQTDRRKYTRILK